MLFAPPRQPFPTIDLESAYRSLGLVWSLYQPDAYEADDATSRERWELFVEGVDSARQRIPTDLGDRIAELDELARQVGGHRRPNRAACDRHGDGSLTRTLG